MHNDWLQADGTLPKNVTSLMTTRHGGISRHPFDTMNVGARVGDDGAAVQANRLRVAEALGCEPVFLQQVHGSRVLRLHASAVTPTSLAQDGEAADAAFTTDVGVACAVQVADCLPVLFAHRDGTVVGAAHAGWRGLAGGVLENTVHAMCAAVGSSPQDIVAWLGPCIGPLHFEVGADVLHAFPDQAAHFVEAPRSDGSMRWRADLPSIARARLQALGLTSIGGGTWCTVADPMRFYSYRRDGVTGRHVAAVCLGGVRSCPLPVA